MITKIAIIHYLITTWRDGKNGLEALVKRFPDADMYTHGRAIGRHGLAVG